MSQCGHTKQDRCVLVLRALAAKRKGSLLENVLDKAVKVIFTLFHLDPECSF